MTTEPEVYVAMQAGDWREAIRLASKFGAKLGDYRKRILDAESAYSNPGFLLQIKKDPEVAIAAGRAALEEYWEIRKCREAMKMTKTKAKAS